jgi:uncharacterized protein YndB with AHSA1/START domain
VSATTSIDVPRERVFELLCDLSARPAFTDHFLSGFRLSRMEPSGVGAGARFQLHEAGEWMDTVIEEIDPPHLIRERGQGGRLNRVPVLTVWELAEGASGEGCEVSVTFWTEPTNPGDRLRELLGASGWFERNWRRALVRLKQVAEAGGPTERVVVAGADPLA